MSNTRRANPEDSDFSPERNLSSRELRGLNISLAIAAQATRRYDERTRRACLWLANVAANSQRIQLCWQRRGLRDPLGTLGRISEDELCERLGVAAFIIRSILSGGEDRPADLATFTSAVEQFRAEFEAALPPLVKTQDRATIDAAFSAASDEHDIAVLTGKWRHGKTEECERKWLTNLDRAVWIHTPSDATEKSFLIAIATTLGIGVSNSKKPVQMREQIKRALGVGFIDTLFLDEAHGLFGSDLANSKPVRAEFVRELRDTLGVGAVLITTEQFALSLEICRRHNARWAPGQLLGRRQPYVLRDKHSKGELRAIVKLHAGAIDDDAVAGLVTFAEAEEGYLGAAINALKRARREARTRGDSQPITAADVAVATAAQQTDERLVALAASSAPRRNRVNLGLADRRAKAAKAAANGPALSKVVPMRRSLVSEVPRVAEFVEGA